MDVVLGGREKVASSCCLELQVGLVRFQSISEVSRLADLEKAGLFQVHRGNGRNPRVNLRVNHDRNG